MELEILAPVGDENGVKIAINSGANAIYLGLPKFNARAKADNITLGNLKNVVDYAHLMNVKVYVTINTIIKDSEVDDFLDMVKVAIDAKVDAFIIQDLGMAYLLKNKFKGIVLHASTQMGVHNLNGAKMLEKFGITRVVLSRETKYEDILEISKNTKLEIEYFVQGALCVAFSGNCYLSSLNNDKSGNRGECMQLCRLKYSAVSDGEQVNQGYLLSTCDLCLASNLKRLVEAGVTSFKIEGRLRRYGYIAESVSQYVSAINNLEKFEPKLIERAMSRVFNRGEYNRGYYLDENNKREIINDRFQNHRGVCVGKVKDVKPFKTLYQITLKSNHKIHTNDGLKFIKDDSEISIGVGNVVELSKDEYKIYSNKKPDVGSDVYLTVDSAYERELTDRKKLINLSVYVDLQKDSVPYIRMRYNDCELEIYGESVLEAAKNAPISVQNVIECFNKVEDYPFNVKVTCSLGGVFIPKSQLNELRRNAYQDMYNHIIKQYEKKNIKAIKECDYELPEIIDDNNYSVIIVDKYDECIESYDKVIFAPNNYTKDAVLEFAKQYNKKFYLNIPNICTKSDMIIIDNLLKGLCDYEVGLVANNIGILSYADTYEVIGGYMLNIVNKYTVAYLNSLGINTFIKSVESIAMDLEYGLEYRGNVSMMTLCHCPYKTAYNYKDCTKCRFDDNLHYVDDMGHDYKVNRYILSNCYFELKEVRDIKQIKRLGVAVDIR